MSVAMSIHFLCVNNMNITIAMYACMLHMRKQIKIKACWNVRMITHLNITLNNNNDNNACTLSIYPKVCTVLLI